MTAFYDFFRYIKLYSTDGVTLEFTLQADSVTDTVNISRGTGVAWTGASEGTDSFKIDVDYTLEVPVTTTTIRLTDVNANDQDIALVAGANMNIARDSANQLTISALIGGISRAITSITQASICVVQTTNVHNFTEGTSVTITDVAGMTQLNGNEYYADILTGTTLALYEDPDLTTAIDSTGFGAYTSAGVVTGEYSGASRLNELDDVLFNVTNFSNSIKIGDTTTGTLNAAAGNVIMGVGAGNAITEGDNNVIIGLAAGPGITAGRDNVLIGKDVANNSNSDGDWTDSVAVGFKAGLGSGNPIIGTETPEKAVFIGSFAGTGHNHDNNVAIGYFAGSKLRDDANKNVAIGSDAMSQTKNDPSVQQSNNVAVGYFALRGASDASQIGNVAIGSEAGAVILDGERNVFVGEKAGVQLTTGDYNTFIGTDAGGIVHTGDGNVIIGRYTGTNGLTDTLAIYTHPTGGPPKERVTITGTGKITVDSTGGEINGNPIVTSNSISGTVAGHIIPDTNIAYDLGSATHKFRDLYLDGASLHLGSTILRDNGSGSLQVNLVNVLQVAADDSTVRTIDSGESIKFSGAGTVTTASDAEGNIIITGSAHTSALSGLTDVHDAAPSDGQVLTWVNANSRWEPVTDVETDITGSVFGDDSTVLVDGVNSAINLDGTMKTHMIPALDATYDIGSAEKKIRDLYVDGGGSFWIGDTTKMQIAPYKFQDASFGHFVELTGVADEPDDSYSPRLCGIVISPDGTKLYTPQADRNSPLPDYMRIVQYTLGTPFDLSTITNTVAPANSLDVSGQVNALGAGGVFANTDTSIGGIHFKPDGTKLWMMTGASISYSGGTGPTYHSANKLVEYDLSSAWDITSATFNNKWSEALYGYSASQFKISEDGRFLYMRSTRTIKQWEMTTPFDISTLTQYEDFNLEQTYLKSYLTVREHSTGSYDNLTDMWISKDGWRWFGLFNHGLSNDGMIYGYTMTTKYDITTSVPIGLINEHITQQDPPYQNSIMIAGSNHPNGNNGQQTGMSDEWGDWTRSIFFADDGKKLYVAGYYDNHPTVGAGGIQQYNITDSIDPQLRFKGLGKGVKIEGEIELASGASVNEISTDTDMSGDSDTAIPTEKAVKTYVDTKVGGSLTVAEEGSDLTTGATKLDFVGTGVTASGTGTTKTITIPGGGGGGGWTAIQTQTVSSSVTSVTFGSLDLSAYSTVRLVISDLVHSNAQYTFLKLSNDGFTSDDTWSQNVIAMFDNTTTSYDRHANSTTFSTGEYLILTSHVVWFDPIIMSGWLDFDLTTSNVICNGQGVSRDDGEGAILWSGICDVTTFTDLKIEKFSGTFESGTFKLLGMA